MGKDKEKSDIKGETPPKGSKSRENITKNETPPKGPKSRDDSASRKKESDKAAAKSKPPKRRTGLFSKFRKSTTDLSEWSKTDEKLQTAVDNDDVSKVQNSLAKKGADPTKVDPKGQTAFHRAAEQGKIEIVEAMITYKANLDAQDVQGRTPLSCAVKYGCTEVADRLLQEKNNSPLGDLKKQTPLHHATMGGSAECVRLLIKYHAPIDQPDKDGRTALHYSSLMGYLNICRELTEAGSNVNAKDVENRTPLMCAAEYGQVQVCELLVKKGASAVFTDINGNNAAQWAAKGGFTEIKGILEKAPTQANWSIGPGPQDEESQDIENRVEVLHHSGRDSPDIVPYEGGAFTEEDQLEQGVVPLERVKNISDFISPSSKESLHSSVKVNYSDDDDICDLVPMEEMRRIHQEQLEELPVDVPDRYHQQQVIGSVSDTEYTPEQPDKVSQHSDSAPGSEHSGEEEIHEIIQNVDVTIVQSRPYQDDTVSQNTIDKDKYDELEEEHEHLSSELQQVMLENRRLQQQVTRLEERLQTDDSHGKQEMSNILVMEDNPLVNSLEAEISDLREEVEVERDKNEALMEQIVQLRNLSQPKVEFDQSGDDSWNDSGEEETFNKKGKSKGSQAMRLAVLKSQVLELTQENVKLKEQMQYDAARVHTSFQESMDTSHSLTDLRELSQFEGIQLAHEQEVRAFRERIGKLEHQLQNFSDRLNEVEDEKFAVSEEKDELQSQYDDLVSANLSMKQEAVHLKQEITQTNSKSSDDKVRDLCKEIEKLRRDNSKLVEDLEGLVEVNEQLQDDKKDLLEQMDSIEDLVQYRQQVQEETEHLKNEKQQLAELMEEIQREMAEKERRDKDKKSSPSEVVIEVQSQSVDCSSPLASLTLEEINIEELQAAPKEDKAVANDDLKTIQAELQKRKSDLTTLEKQTSTAVADLTQMRSDIIKERKDFTALQDEVSRAQDELTFVEKALSVQKDELKKVEHILKSKKQKDKQKSDESDKEDEHNEAGSILDQLESLNQALAVKRTESSALQTKKEHLLSENQQALDYKEAAEEEIRKLKDEKQFLLCEQESLEGILGSEKATVHNLEEDIKKLRQRKEDIDRLQVDKETLKSQIDQVEVIQVQQVHMLKSVKPETAPTTDSGAYDALIEENKNLGSANTKLKDQIEQLMESNDHLGKKNSVLSEELKQVIREKQELSAKEATVSTQLQEIINVNLQLTRERSEMEERITEAVKVSEDVESKASQYEKELKQALQENKKATGEHKQVQQQLEEADVEHRKLLEEKSELQKHITQMQESQKDTESESNNLNRLLKVLQEEKKDLTAESVSLQDNMLRLNQSNKDLQRQITAAELKCQDLVKENEQWSDHNTRLAKEVESLSDDNNNLKIHTKELSQKVVELHDQLKDLGGRDQKVEIEKYEIEHKLLKEDNEKSKKYIEKLEFQAGVSAGMDYRAECERLLSDNAYLLAEINTMREENQPMEVTVLRNQNEELQSERKQLETNNSDLQNLIDSLNQTVGKDKALESKGNQKDRELTHLKDEIQKLREAKNSLEQQNQQLVKEAKVINNNMATLQKASEEIIRDQQQEKNVHEEKIAKLLNNNEHMFEKVEALQKENKDLQSAHSMLQKNLNDITSERRKESEKEVNKELANMKGKLTLVQNEKLALLNDIEALQREIDAIKLKEQMRQSVNKDAPERLASVQAQLQTERKAKEELEKQTEDLLKEREKWKAKQVPEVIEVKAQPVLLSSRKTNEQVKPLQEKNDKLSGAIDHLKATNEKLTSEVEALKKELKSTKKKSGTSAPSKELMGELSKLTEENKGLQTTASKLQGKMQDLKEENEAKLQGLMEEQDMLLEKIKELESSAAAQSKNRGELLNAGDVSEKDEIIQDLEAKCEQMNVQIKNKDKQVQELQDGMTKLEKSSKNRSNAVGSSASDAYLASLREENSNLRERLTEAEGSKVQKIELCTTKLVMDVDVKSEEKQLKDLQDQLDSLKSKLAESEQHHHEVVNTYRSHLLAAVQGCMDPDVKKSLKHILSLRNNNTK